MGACVSENKPIYSGAKTRSNSHAAGNTVKNQEK